MPEFYANTIAQVADLIPYAMNSRTHSEEQVAQIAASIREFGFTNPVLIDEANNLIAGHGRVLAARKLNLDQVPAVVVTGLDENRAQGVGHCGQQAGTECRVGSGEAGRRTAIYDG
jgi:hypothetical protein